VCLVPAIPLSSHAARPNRGPIQQLHAALAIHRDTCDHVRCRTSACDDFEYRLEKGEGVLYPSSLRRNRALILQSDVLKTPKLSKLCRVGLRLAFIAAFSAMHVLGPCSFWPPSTSVSSCSHDLPPCCTRRTRSDQMACQVGENWVVLLRVPLQTLRRNGDCVRRSMSRSRPPPRTTYHDP